MADGEKKRVAEKKSLSIRTVTLLTLIAACVLAAASILFIRRTEQTNRAMRRADENYIVCSQTADELMDASDYLTEMVRTFAITGDETYAERYFEEVNVTRRRDHAVQTLGSLFGETPMYSYLLSALERSNALMESEYYAMRLNIEALGLSLDRFPENVAALELMESDRLLSAGEKRAHAIEILFDEQYERSKEGIRDDVSDCLDTLLKELEKEQGEATELHLRAQNAQTLLILMLVAVIFLSAILNWYLVVSPLLASVGHVRQNEPMISRGSAEIRFLCETYNEVFEHSRRHQEQLSYDASHDDLTDLHNRGVFDRLRSEYNDGTAAMILVDVDKFKEINDGYGHDVGDKALVRVATWLKKSFRNEDYVCRIGGDEFAVIMLNANSSLRELVEGKISRLNEKLGLAEDGLPPISVSVGVAFGDRENPTDDFYKDADSALYRVKESGGRNCAFY